MGKLYRDLVRQHSTAKGSVRAVLNVLADYANDSGFAWPGRALLASEAGVSERTVIRAIQKLCADGWVEVAENASGGRGKKPGFKITPPTPQKGDIKGDNSAAERVTTCHQKGDNVTVKGDNVTPDQSYARSEPHEPYIEPGGDTAHPTSPNSDVDFYPPTAPSKKNTKHEMYLAVCEALGWDARVLSDKSQVLAAETVIALDSANYTVEDIRRFMVEVWFEDWRWIKRKSRPSLEQLRDEIGKLRAGIPVDMPQPKQTKGMSSLQRLAANNGVAL